MKLRTCLALLALIAISCPLLAEDTNEKKGDAPEKKGEEKQKKEEFPVYEGVVTADRVNIRSGPSTNYRGMIRVKKGYRLLVIGKEGDWARISTPDECLLWINKEYVKVDSDTKTGAITANHVNIRIAPEAEADIVGQVDKDMSVEITGGEGDWLEISPPSTTSAWISASYVQRVEPEK